LFSVLSIATATVTIGAAGAGGTAGANNGGTGGASVWQDGTNTLQANGGVGGLGAATGSFQIPSLGGTASGGSVNVIGNVGVIATIASTTASLVNSSKGGDSLYGPGGRQNHGVSITGIDGLGNGSGGSGAANSPSQTSKAGGAGTLGIIVVYEFY
jgi:hypothetical protein